MDAGELAKLFKEGKTLTYARGQTVIPFGVDNEVFYIRRGYVKRTVVDRHGGVSIQSIFGPGYFFPLTPMYLSLYNLKVTHRMSDYIYIAVTETEAVQLNVGRLREYLQTNYQAYPYLLYESGRRLESFIQQVENIALRDAYRRVAHQLAYLARQFGHTTSAGTRIRFPVTQQDISEMVSLNRETVSRQISRLRRRGIIGPERELVILDTAALEAAFG